MRNFTKIALSGIVGIALTACGSSSSSSGGTTTPPPPVPNDVNFTALVDTDAGGTGYKINVDINGSYGGVVDVYPNIEYYFCTDAISTWDYFAVTPKGSDYNGSYEPDFDYGDLNINGSDHLVFTSASGQITNPSNTYTLDENVTLTEGGTYSLWLEGQAGSITINSISDFNCTTITGGP